jgi:hypothetical protein
MLTTLDLLFWINRRRVWKTIDGGNEWFPVSDSIFKSSAVGAITVAPSDANVVYVGMGEADMRSNISLVTEYKSVNGGKHGLASIKPMQLVISKYILLMLILFCSCHG